MTNFDTLLKTHIEEIAIDYGLKAIEITFNENAYGIGIVKMNEETNDGNFMYEKQYTSVSVIRNANVIEINIDYPRNEHFATITHTLRLYTFDIAVLSTIVNDIDNAIFHNLFM